jgi:hypothetical protein
MTTIRNEARALFYRSQRLVGMLRGQKRVLASDAR